MNIQFKRKRQGKTDYRKRIRLLKSNKLRMVIRKSLKNILIQIIKFEPNGDKILLSAHTNELKKYGLNKAKRNTPSAYLLGLLIALKAKKQNIKELIVDTGLPPSTKGSIIYAAVKGAIDGGLKIPHSKEIFPDNSRIEGKHLKSFLFKEIKEKIIAEK